MKKQKGFTSIELSTAVFIIVFVVFIIGSWVINFVKLTSCDFASNYKCEAIHGVGVIVPPLSFVTVWFDTDENNN